MHSSGDMGLSKVQSKVKHQILSPFRFWMYLLTSLPMGWIAGLRIEALDENTCVTSVPFNWLTKNPFRSMYFSVQSMAAELSTAAPCLVAIQGHDPSVAFIIVDLKAKFPKKANNKVYFTCEDVGKAFEAVEKSIVTQTPQLVTLHTKGTMKDGTVVAEFEFTWSFKQRAKKA